MSERYRRLGKTAARLASSLLVAAAMSGCIKPYEHPQDLPPAVPIVTAIGPEGKGDTAPPIGDPNQIHSAAEATEGGNPINLGDEMPIVRILTTNTQGPGYCTAAIKGPQILRTAGHCTMTYGKDSPYNPHSVDPVSAGYWEAVAELQYAGVPTPTQTIEVNNIVVHPDYVTYNAGNVAGNDMAVYHLAEPINTVPGINFVETASLTSTVSITKGTSVEISGYGGGDLNEPKTITNTVSGFEGKPNFAEATLFTVSPVKDEQGNTMKVIGGDSGSPVRHKGKQIGIVSGIYINGPQQYDGLIVNIVNPENNAALSLLEQQVQDIPKAEPPMHYLYAEIQPGNEDVLAETTTTWFNAQVPVEAVVPSAQMTGTIFYDHEDIPETNALGAMHLNVETQHSRCFEIGEPIAGAEMKITQVTSTTIDFPTLPKVITRYSLDLEPATEPPTETQDLPLASFPITSDCDGATDNEVWMYPVTGGPDPQDSDFMPTTVQINHNPEGEPLMLSYQFSPKPGQVVEASVSVPPQPIHIEPGQTFDTKDTHGVKIHVESTQLDNACSTSSVKITREPSQFSSLFDLQNGSETRKYILFMNRETSETVSVTLPSSCNNHSFLPVIKK